MRIGKPKPTIDSADKPVSIAQAHSMFRDIKRQFRPRKNANGLVCKVGRYHGCAVIKLQKPAWTNDSMRKVPNQTGVFFSVWIDPKSIGVARYNIHSLKLGKLKHHHIITGDFARAFRRAFARSIKSWPNVRTDYGPQTLMQGWIESHRPRFERDVTALLNRFQLLCPMIDRFLEDCAAPSRRRSTPARTG